MPPCFNFCLSMQSFVKLVSLMPLKKLVWTSLFEVKDAVLRSPAVLSVSEGEAFCFLVLSFPTRRLEDVSYVRCRLIGYIPCNSA